MVRVLHTLAGLLSLAAAAAASPYWISYEGDGYPENEGWTRHAYEGGAIRSLDNGEFITDGTASLGIVDYYDRYRPAGVNPGPGETLVLEWRVRVENASDSDQGIGFYTDNRRAVAFNMGLDRAEAVFVSPPTYIYYAPHMAHTFRLQSPDLVNYSLYVDDILAQQGTFWPYAVQSSRLTWGDGVSGATSWAAWDYVRFAVVPEPVTLAALSIMALAVRRRRTRAAHRESVTCEGLH